MFSRLPMRAKDKIYVIAEIGINHDGCLQNAYKLIDAAVDAGCDCVKFQFFKTENLVSHQAAKAAYQNKGTSATESQFEMLKQLELSVESHMDLADYCRSRQIAYLATPFDLESLEHLIRMNVTCIKIASGEITNYQLLHRIGELNRVVYLSTGMSDLGEVEDALQILMEAGTERDRITVLHCNTEYPTPYEDVNLLSMNTIGNAFGVQVGYSDHTPGIEVSLAAVALGAIVIEKHFTIDRQMEGPDHQASLEPSELKALVSGIRHIEKALGNPIKAPSKSERKNISIARKSIHLARDLPQGHRIEISDLVFKRPGDGIQQKHLDLVIGRELAKSLRADHKLRLNELK